MLLERWQKFDIHQQPNGDLVLVQKDTQMWQGRALFMTKQPDGSFVYSCGIEEQGVPAACWSANTALGWLIARDLFNNTDIQTWSEIAGNKQGAD